MDQVEAAIREWDRSAEVEIYLTNPSGEWLGVATGKEGIFLGYAVGDDRPGYQAVGDPMAIGVVDMVIGQQPTCITRRYLSDLEAIPLLNRRRSPVRPQP